MNSELLYSLFFATGFIGLLAFTEFLYKRYNVPAEITRKIAHIISCLFSLVFLLVFQSYWYVIIVGGFFFLLLFIGKRFNIFKSIYSVKRKTSGSYLLPVSICMLFFISKESNNPLLFILPLLTLGISDPLAAIFGILFQSKTRRIVLLNRAYDKTFLGSSVFFISTFFISILVLPFFSFTGIQLVLWALFLAAFAAFIEIISLNGTDNITVPLAICLVLYFMT